MRVVVRAFVRTPDADQGTDSHSISAESLMPNDRGLASCNPSSGSIASCRTRGYCPLSLRTTSEPGCMMVVRSPPT
jgi:hypothetical protein